MKTLILLSLLTCGSALAITQPTEVALTPIEQVTLDQWSELDSKLALHKLNSPAVPFEKVQIAFRAAFPSELPNSYRSSYELYETMTNSKLRSAELHADPLVQHLEHMDATDKDCGIDIKNLCSDATCKAGVKEQCTTDGKLTPILCLVYYYESDKTQLSTGCQRFFALRNLLLSTSRPGTIGITTKTVGAVKKPATP